MTSWFALGERRAGIRMVHQRGLGPGTALVRGIMGADGAEVLGRDLVSPRGRWGSPGVGRGGEREKRKEEKEVRKQEGKKGRDLGVLLQKP